MPGDEAVERRLAELWREVLGRDDLDPTADWFEAGGDSAFAVLLMSRIAEEFDVELDVDQIYERPTVPALAAEIAGELPREDA